MKTTKEWLDKNDVIEIVKKLTSIFASAQQLEKIERAGLMVLIIHQLDIILDLLPEEWDEILKITTGKTNAL